MMNYLVLQCFLESFDLSQLMSETDNNATEILSSLGKFFNIVY
jgi:hypothetical protein